MKAQVTKLLNNVGPSGKKVYEAKMPGIGMQTIIHCPELEIGCIIEVKSLAMLSPGFSVISEYAFKHIIKQEI